MLLLCIKGHIMKALLNVLALFTTTLCAHEPVFDPPTTLPQKEFSPLPKQTTFHPYAQMQLIYPGVGLSIRREVSDFRKLEADVSLLFPPYESYALKNTFLKFSGAILSHLNTPNFYFRYGMGGIILALRRPRPDLFIPLYVGYQSSDGFFDIGCDVGIFREETYFVLPVPNLRFGLSF
jgi:hypothetical protein